jgi:hypothetical protein
MKSVLFRRSCGILTVFLLFIGVLGASAQHAAKGNPKNDDAGLSGQQAAADTKAQKVRPPTQEEIQTLLEGMKSYVNQSTQGLQVKRTASGAQYVDLDGRFENLSVAKIGADGKVETECVNNITDAKKFLESKDTRKPAPKAPQQSDPSTWEVK